MAGFQEDVSGAKSNAHPAQVVPHYLASPNEDSRSLRMKQMEQWYMGYQQKRGHEIVYKSMDGFARFSISNSVCSSASQHSLQRNTFSNTQVFDRSMVNDTLKLPLSSLKFLCPKWAVSRSPIISIYFCDLPRNSWYQLHWETNFIPKWLKGFIPKWLMILRFDAPPDGMPCVRDWLTCFESMLTAGPDLGREPLSCSVRYSNLSHQNIFANLLCQWFCFQILGWSKRLNVSLAQVSIPDGSAAPTILLW